MANRAGPPSGAATRPGTIGADDGIRTRDPHLGKVTKRVRCVRMGPVCCEFVRSESATSVAYVLVVERSTTGCWPYLCDRPEPKIAGSRRSPSRPSPSMQALREHARRAVLRCSRDGDGRRSVAVFCVWSDAPDTAGYALVLGGLGARPRPTQNAMRKALRSVISDANRIGLGVWPARSHLGTVDRSAVLSVC
jgi:hypothetical protein